MAANPGIVADVRANRGVPGAGGALPGGGGGPSGNSWIIGTGAAHRG